MPSFFQHEQMGVSAKIQVSEMLGSAKGELKASVSPWQATTMKSGDGDKSGCLFINHGVPLHGMRA